MSKLQDRWSYVTADQRNPSSRHEIWYLREAKYQYKIVRRGAFFDAQRDNLILDRFSTLEAAQRCVETISERVPPRTRKRAQKQA